MFHDGLRKGCRHWFRRRNLLTVQIDEMNPRALIALFHHAIFVLTDQKEVLFVDKYGLQLVRLMLQLSKQVYHNFR
ncbi:hypothetical protein HNR39_002480 [Glaciimonas immobilis]|uniref:Uncharacterized protein n=1 Tax=Glaciimonas immobilis TaxID=728004 RepID=A0A840RUB1_9BURK|nr:hypothetical protein [Glaciimonas immobilis]